MFKASPVRLVILFALFVFLWLIRPWLHPLLMPIMRQPIFIILFILFIVMLIGVVRRKVFPRIGLLLVIFAWVAVKLFSSQLSLITTSKVINFTPRDVLQDVSQVRLLPKEVAARYGADSLQNPQERLADSQIVFVDGTLKRVAPRLPDGLLLYFLKPMTGVVTIDVDKLERKSSTIDQEFKYSEGVGLSRNIYFQLHKKKFFVDYSEPIYLKDPETSLWVTVVPYITYEKFPFRVPVWGGFMLVRANGDIEDHEPGDANNLAVTKGNRVFPKELARYYAESYSYKNGLLNVWFLHKDQGVIDDLDRSPQPFHIATVDGYKQVVVSRPVGNSFGIFKMFIFDATTGKREIIEYGQNTQLTGPVAAVDYVKKAFPTIDYNSFSVVEPRPLAVQGKLYWLASIINDSSAGVAHTVVVDAATTNVIALDKPEEVVAFVKSGIANAAPPAVGEAGQTTIDLDKQISDIQKQLEDLRKNVQELKSPTIK